jgi:hypothetical protein|tara:strand:- start:660 stop:929 length:270 start_codon:yes stop_codon:yes gene_type:complete
LLINTHGIEVEENEHAVERKQYNDILPRIEHSDIAKELKQQAGTNHLFKCLDTVEWRAADRIMELEAEVKKLKELVLYVLLEREELESK